jgi:hypothetical protein
LVAIRTIVKLSFRLFTFSLARVIHKDRRNIEEDGHSAKGAEGGADPPAIDQKMLRLNFISRITPPDFY